MTMSVAREEPAETVSPSREDATQVVHYNTEELVARTWVKKRASSTSEVAEDGHLAGDPRALLASRLIATAALLVSAMIHTRLAFQLGVGGAPLGQGQLFLLNALACGALAIAMFSGKERVWLFAVVLSAAGLLGILASVYFPVASVGPFPAIDEPAWLLTKAVCALAELTVISLWLIRRIAPANPLEAPASPLGAPAGPLE